LVEKEMEKERGKLRDYLKKKEIERERAKERES